MTSVVIDLPADLGVAGFLDEYALGVELHNLGCVFFQCGTGCFGFEDFYVFAKG